MHTFCLWWQGVEIVASLQDKLDDGLGVPFVCLTLRWRNVPEQPLEESPAGGTFRNNHWKKVPLEEMQDVVAGFVGKDATTLIMGYLQELPDLPFIAELTAATQPVHQVFDIVHHWFELPFDQPRHRIRRCSECNRWGAERFFIPSYSSICYECQD